MAWHAWPCAVRAYTVMLRGEHGVMKEGFMACHAYTVMLRGEHGLVLRTWVHHLPMHDMT